MGCFQHLNRLKFPNDRKPKYIGQAMVPPSWWRQTEIMTALDKIMANKVRECMADVRLMLSIPAQEADIDPTLDSIWGQSGRSAALSRGASCESDDETQST